MVKPLFGIFPIPLAREADLVFRAVRLADESGLDLVTVQDHPYNGEFFDTWTLLSNLAGLTSRVRLMTNVADLPLRQPAVLAKSAATLDLLSKGRVELGLGAGAFWRAISGYGGPSRSPGEAVSALEEAINIMRLIWGEKSPKDRVSFAGRFYHLDGAHPGPRPPHHIRIWVGALGPRMLRLTGKLADGWSVSLGYAPPAKLSDMNRIIDEALKESRRNRESVRRMYNVGGVITQEKESHAGLRKDGVIVGPPDVWAETLTRFYQEFGMDTFTFAAGGGNDLEQFRLFGEEVVPRTRRSIEQVPPASVPT